MNYPNFTPPKAKKKTHPALIAVIAGLVVLVAACCGIGVLANSGNDKKPSATATTAACEHGTLPNGSCAANSAGPKAERNTVAPMTQAPTTQAAPAVPTITDGTWTVGEDFPAGTYKASSAGDRCYWAIYTSGHNQSFDSLITNHLGGGSLRVTLKAGQDFETKRCGTWAKV